MSNKYKLDDTIPDEVICARLDELSKAVSEGRDAVNREFTMRIPAECDRDADLVLAYAAKRLRELSAPQQPQPAATLPEGWSLDVFDNGYVLKEKGRTVYDMFERDAGIPFDHAMCRFFDALTATPSPIAQPAAVEGEVFICFEEKINIDGEKCKRNVAATLDRKKAISWRDGSTMYHRKDFECHALANPSAVVNSPSQEAIEASEQITMEGALKKAEKQLGMIGAAVAIPEGMALVPIEPTPKMVDATWDHEIDKNGGIESHGKRNRRIYKAMLSAAQSQGDAE